MKNIFISLIYMFFISCMSFAVAEEEADVLASLPAIDTSSPETALKSYWVYLDWKDRIFSQYLQSSTYRFDAQIRDRLLEGERLVLENWREKERFPKSFRREIVQIVQSGEDTAEIIAHIRNVTPNEPAAAPGNMSKVDKLMFSQKTNGRRFKYLMGKKDGAWRVTQVLVEKAIYGDKTGWEPAYTIPFAPANTLALDP